MKDGTVNVRSGRDNKVHGMRTIAEVLHEFQQPEPTFGGGAEAPAAVADAAEPAE